jgi:hypothetical protein
VAERSEARVVPPNYLLLANGHQHSGRSDRPNEGDGPQPTLEGSGPRTVWTGPVNHRVVARRALGVQRRLLSGFLSVTRRLDRARADLT